MAKRVAHRIPRPWTKEDVRELKTHSRARTPVIRVSKAMKRTVGALRRRAGILGIGLGRRHHKLRPVASFLRTRSLPDANLSSSQLVNTARKMHFEVERLGL